mmetsp:Transcript_15313/g.33205  ORF Transcript_15313/g.33205 Transcript_15313/m.33205 type:complete len:299 (-) Transcript_15313:1252-2148(-)
MPLVVVGCALGRFVGLCVGLFVGLFVGCFVVGLSVGPNVGLVDGQSTPLAQLHPTMATSNRVFSGHISTWDFTFSEHFTKYLHPVVSRGRMLFQLPMHTISDSASARSKRVSAFVVISSWEDGSTMMRLLLLSKFMLPMSIMDDPVEGSLAGASLSFLLPELTSPTPSLPPTFPYVGQSTSWLQLHALMNVSNNKLSGHGWRCIIRPLTQDTNSSQLVDNRGRYCDFTLLQMVSASWDVVVWEEAVTLIDPEAVATSTVVLDDGNDVTQAHSTRSTSSHFFLRESKIIFSGQLNVKVS